MRELRELEEAHPELRSPDSPTQRVGGQPREGCGTQPHDLSNLIASAAGVSQKLAAHEASAISSLRTIHGFVVSPFDSGRCWSA